MLVIPETKSLVLKLSKPQAVLDAIPGAKRITHAGKELVSVPHGLDEAKVLRNLGVHAPSPMLHYYKWRGRYTPFEHQKLTSAFLTMHKKCVVLNEIGTGKTVSVLWAADYLMDVGAIKKVLIISPLSTLERVWADSIYTNFPNRRSVTLHGAAAKRKKLLAANADFYIVNHDGFEIIWEEACGKFDLVVVDEAAVYRNPTTSRFRILRKFMERNKDTKLWMLTGTPTPNEPTDAWSLSRLVENPKLGAMTYTAFKDKVMNKIGQWKWIPKPESYELVAEVLQPSIRFTRDECLDLPETIMQTREVKMTQEQQKHYKEMLKSLVTEVAEGKITAVNEAIKMQKLIQIACGCAYDSTGKPIELDCAPRISALKEVIDEAGGKIIVFVPLTGVLHILRRELSKHYSVAVVNGAVSANERNVIFKNFQNENEPQILLAHPATMAHGLTLTASSNIVWYGPITSNEMYTQANGRIERIGKKHVSNVIHIEATIIERKLYERLSSKQKIQGLLLDFIENGDI